MVTETVDTLKLSTTVPPPANGGGLIITATDDIRTFLTAASIDSNLSKDLRDLSCSLIINSTIPYKSLKTIWSGSGRGIRPD
ncbi:hypothetical protein CASFOL_037031 [Castilleja foliolosa]|uniref:Uncharacterized protein n=1 Tax=Castilleja foliolosa TaxID=1961234 RepID=A0ABD3BPN6_9LAMI